MKKALIIISISLLGILLFVTFYKIFFNTKTMYYTYEGKFVMSSTSNKVNDYKELGKDYFIKEKITKVRGNEEIVEVVYSEGFNEPYHLYGYYTTSEFDNYFKNQIEDGFSCSNKEPYYLEEANSMKCTIHKTGYKYENIESEACIIINNKNICIKPHDWKNIEKYKKSFIKAGWVCEYTDYNTGAKDDNIIPDNGSLECMKEKITIYNEVVNNPFCNIGSDGSAVCGDYNGWCSISSDLNTNCFGIK